LATDFGISDEEKAWTKWPKVKIEDVTGLVFFSNVWQPIVHVGVGWKQTHKVTSDSEVTPDEGTYTRLGLVKCLSLGLLIELGDVTMYSPNSTY